MKRELKIFAAYFFRFEHKHLRWELSQIEYLQLSFGNFQQEDDHSSFANLLT